MMRTYKRVEITFNNKSCYVEKSFAATCFGSCTRNRNEAGKLRKKTCHVEQLIQIYTARCVKCLKVFCFL
jgi:hypothetical protein